MESKLIKTALVGAPNVGKSLIFNHLTGKYVAVSNYPGTTVDVSRGILYGRGKTVEIIDTPGIYSLIPMTEEEGVTRQILYTEKIDFVIHVIDAKNIRRMLSTTFQLIDAGLPVVLVLNMIDEAKKMGLLFDVKLLSKILGIPVIATSAAFGQGMLELKSLILAYEWQKYKPVTVEYQPEIEAVVEQAIKLVAKVYNWPKRMLMLLVLQDDKMADLLLAEEPKIQEIYALTAKLMSRYKYGLIFQMAMERQQIIDKILNAVLLKSKGKFNKRSEKISRYTREPLTGVPILLIVLYLVYQFVGNFGAGTLVDWINQTIFVTILNPIVNYYCLYIPWEWLRNLIVGDYGIFTLGIRYAVIIVLPIVGTFFIIFAFLEDSGYLPRLAMLLDKIFSYIGLNGRAVIPLCLGFGCGTMAVMVTRTLQSNRERLIATILLALCIPCSAQLGVVLGILSHNGFILGVWALSILLVFIFIGWISARLIPGKRSSFYMELPPLRMPIMANVLLKAYHRMIWYFLEILPLFILTSVFLWSLDEIGFLPRVLTLMEPVMGLLGLPNEAAQIFLLGFFRRDYGAAGLYDLCIQGLLTDRQLLISAVTLTLFLPCVAQVVVMIKERGVFTSIFIVLLVVVIAVLMGAGLNQLLTII